MTLTFSRREMIRRVLRIGGLGAVGGVAALLVARSGRCATPGPCGGCPLFENCALPMAESARHGGETPAYPQDDG